MKTLIVVIILIFSFQSLTRADDIKDFQIEGMSIGDSLLDYFSNDLIKKNIIEDYPNSDEYKRVQLMYHKSFRTYDAMHILYKKGDKKKIIQSINGMKMYVNKVDSCLKKKKLFLMR